VISEKHDLLFVEHVGKKAMGRGYLKSKVRGVG
jgi:hypothetical protein